MNTLNSTTCKSDITSSAVCLWSLKIAQTMSLKHWLIITDEGLRDISFFTRRGGGIVKIVGYSLLKINSKHLEARTRIKIYYL